MATDAALSPEQINHLWDTRVGEPNEKYPLLDGDKLQFARAIEQAVLQSPEVQRLSMDAERYAWLKANGSMSVDSFVDKFRVVDAAVSLVITDWVDSFDEAIDAAMEKQP